MTYEELLQSLPTCPGNAVFPVNADPAGLAYVEKGLPEFVGPDLSLGSGTRPIANARVVIVSAAGAVGKSTLARQLAFQKHAPLWDLAHADAVGGKSLTGQISSSFGFKLASDVTARLVKGEVFIVIDALDEARVKANEAGFEAFVRNIAAVAKESQAASFVLFGRTQSALWTQMLLDDERLPTSLVTIKPFTREQAERYIEARIGQMDEAARRRIRDHRGPFEEARNLILGLLERAVCGENAAPDDSAREFLGYAPVLETVAVLLGKEGNFQELIGALTAMGRDDGKQSARPLRVLQHVVTRLMERERDQKLQHNIRPALENVAAANAWSAWGTLYQPDEQVGRLLGCILGRRIEACPAMPPAVRAIYEEHLAEWVPEHPFLRDGNMPANKVFESYLFALAMREHLTDVSRHVEDQVASAEYRPSRLLADFYILLGEEQHQEAIAKRQIGYLYDSLLAGETEGLKVRLSIEDGDPDDEDEEEGAEGEFELVYAARGDGGRDVIERRSFRIEGDHAPISFRRQLKDATVVSREAVSLGGMLDDFEVGPSVDVRCGRLLIQSAGLVVRGQAGIGENESVTLEAQGCESRLARRPVVRGSLSVCWPGATGYPWTEYATEPAERDNDPRMHEAMRRLRRIVLTLRSHSKGSLARFRDKVEHRRVLKNAMGKALLARLCVDRILKLEEDFYHWVPDRASSILRVSWLDLRNRRASAELRQYLRDFIDQNAKLFA